MLNSSTIRCVTVQPSDLLMFKFEMFHCPIIRWSTDPASDVLLFCYLWSTVPPPGVLLFHHLSSTDPPSSLLHCYTLRCSAVWPDRPFCQLCSTLPKSLFHCSTIRCSTVSPSDVPLFCHLCSTVPSSDVLVFHHKMFYCSTMIVPLFHHQMFSVPLFHY